MYDLEIARSYAHVDLTESLVEEMAAAGVKNLEFQVCAVKIDEDPEKTLRDFQEKKELLDRFGIRILSVHLPFGPNWEMCVPDDFIRERAVKRYVELIELCRFLEPKRYVLHPGYPGVPAAERQTRIENFRRNVKLMAAAASPAKIAVENMPQDCLGNTSWELIELVEGIENLCVCYDANHWFHEKNYDALAVLGTRIETVHISDYDEVEERHWLPGEGTTDWNRIIGGLEAIGYRGPFLYECLYSRDFRQVAENKEQLFAAYNTQK